MATATSRRLPPSIGASSTSHSSRLATTSFPAYEPLSNPLSEAAQRTLHELPQTHPLTSLRQHQNQAITSLINVLGDINELRSARRIVREKARERGLEDAEVAAERDGEVEKFGEDVDALNEATEAGMRKLVDCKSHLEATETVLRDLDANIVAGNGAIAPTQSTLGASQARRRMPGQFEDDGDADGEGNEDQEFASTQSTPSSTPSGPPPSKMLKRKLATAQQEYSLLSLSEKYASHNDYIEFKKVLHDAQHPGDDAPPLPHASTWFNDPAAPNNQSRANTKGKGKNKQGRAAPAALGAQEESSDEDVQIAAERRSTRCPLTLLPMRDPISSTKCPHSFERSAIFEMLGNSDVYVPADTNNSQTQSQSQRGGHEKALDCPECRTQLRAGDLRPDAALLRRIQRIERQAREREQHDDGGDSNDDDDDNDDNDDIRDSNAPSSTQMMKKVVELGNRQKKNAMQIKAEKMMASSGQTPRRGGVVQDLMREVDDEEEEEEEEEGEEDEEGDDEEEEGIPETQVE